MKDDVDPRQAADTASRSRMSPRTTSTPSVEFRIRAAAERPHAVAAGDELLDEVQSEEAPGAGDQCVHDIMLSYPTLP